jgi:hypothetical protein
VPLLLFALWCGRFGRLPGEFSFWLSWAPLLCLLVGGVFPVLVWVFVVLIGLVCVLLVVWVWLCLVLVLLMLSVLGLVCDELLVLAAGQMEPWLVDCWLYLELAYFLFFLYFFLLLPLGSGYHIPNHGGPSPCLCSF